MHAHPYVHNMLPILVHSSSSIRTGLILLYPHESTENHLYFVISVWIGHLYVRTRYTHAVEDWWTYVRRRTFAVQIQSEVVVWLGIHLSITQVHTDVHVRALQVLLYFVQLAYVFFAASLCCCCLVSKRLCLLTLFEHGRLWIHPWSIASCRIVIGRGIVSASSNFHS